MTLAFLEKFERLELFSEREAWMLFRVAAFGEGIGWSLLGSAVLFGNRVLPHGDAVKIAGQVHGTLFLLYLAITCAAYASLGWSRKRTIIAAAASIPPFGTLVFERWEAYRRQWRAAKHRRDIDVRAIIMQGDLLLAVQPADSTAWELPGGLVRADESAETALARHVQTQTGVMPQLGQLEFVVQSRKSHAEQLTLFFSVQNDRDFARLGAHPGANGTQVAAALAHGLDDLQFIQPRDNSDLVPTFLRQTSFAAHAQKRSTSPTFITE